MTWVDKGDKNEFAQAEVVLEFVRSPGYQVGIYSNDVSGCFRGFREVRIGELTSWTSAWGYSRSLGDATSPWSPDPWWCP